MIVGFHHPGIVVPDLEKARQFYCDGLGFQVIRNYDWDESFSDTAEKVLGVSDATAKCLLLKGQNCFLELFEFQTPVSQGNPFTRQASDNGIAHLSFQVIDIFTVFEQVKSAGGISHGVPVQVGEGFSIYFRDPFGNIIELVQIGKDEADFDLIEEDLLPFPHLIRKG